MNIYDTHDLVDVINNLEPVPSFWLDTFFPVEHRSESEFIVFDELTDDRRLAPFVAPNVQGQPMLELAESAKMFKPAYVKPKDPVNNNRVLRRRAGESIGGSMSSGDRHDATVADILNSHRRGIMRRWEWMACQAVVNGQVEVQGENYPSKTVLFGRDAGNTVALSGTAQWSNAAADPIANLKAWAAVVRKSGRPARNIIMGSDALAAFLQNEKVQKALDTRRGSSVTLESFSVADEAVEYVGTLPNGVRILGYSETYTNDDGSDSQFLDSNRVVVAGDVQGHRCFGAIMDARSNYQALPIFPKMWQQEDPSGVFVMSQSAPLMVPARPNASMVATVL